MESNRAKIYSYSIAQDNTECRELVERAYEQGWEDSKEEILKAFQGWLVENSKLGYIPEVRALWDILKSVEL